jgi:hypothetical protein
MKTMSFITEAFEQLQWIDSEINRADESDRRSLEQARDELMELIWVACEKESSAKLRQ